MNVLDICLSFHRRRLNCFSLFLTLLTFLSAFCRFCSLAQLSAAFSSADAFCMPSDSETLGFVVLESMASGVPVVGANAGGIPSIIEHEKTSFLAETGNTAEFVKYLKVIRDKKEKGDDTMNLEAREEAMKHSWEAATSVLRNVQYELAIQNFKQRSFWGYGGPKTGLYGRVFKLKLRWLVNKIKFIFLLQFLTKKNEEKSTLKND